MFRAQGKSIVEAVRLVFEHIEGSASVAVEFDDSNNSCVSNQYGLTLSASSQNEKYFGFCFREIYS